MDWWTIRGLVGGPLVGWSTGVLVDCWWVCGPRVG